MTTDLIAHHLRACDGFSRVTNAVAPDQWGVPTPCAEWDASALVEHVIGFHDFLLLRPLGVRAHRPRTDPAARWAATAAALAEALGAPGVLDRTTELPGGGSNTPRVMLGALTTDTLVHTWDLARAVGVASGLDVDMCAHALSAAVGMKRETATIGPEVTVGDNADAVTKLVAFYGRDPSWPERSST